MLLHESLEDARKEHIIVKNPTEGAVIPKAETTPMKILNEEQLEKFIEEIEKEPLWYDFFYMEITTGLRRGEICGLRWEDYDADRKILTIRRSVSIGVNGEILIGNPKTDNGIRTILLPDKTAKILDKRLAGSYSEWIFPNLQHCEKPTNPVTAYNNLKRILKKADLPQIRFHDLRHTFATYAQANGVDTKTLSSILGHSNASFTLDRYTHVTTEMQKHGAAAIGTFMTDITGG